MQTLSRIQKEMKLRKISKKEICDKLGISDTNFTQWQKGKTGYIKHIPEIAKILGVTVEYLTTGKESDAEIWYRKYLSASNRDRKIIDLILEEYN